MTDFGIPGAIILVWMVTAFFLAIFLAYYNTDDHELRMFLMASAAGVTAYLAGGLLDNIAVGDRPFIFLAVVAGLGTAVSVHTIEHRKPAISLWLKMTSRWLLAPVIVIALLSLILFHSARDRNQAVAVAHKVIYSVRQAGQEAHIEFAEIIPQIEETLSYDGDNPFLYSDLASLYAWQGNYEASIKALRYRLKLDSQEPLDYYAPFIRWRRYLTDYPDQDKWTDTHLV